MKDIKKQYNGWQESLTFFYHISGWIVGPILLGIIIGKWLDNRYQTAPRYLIIALIVAFIFSQIGLFIQVVRYNRRLSSEENKKHPYEQP